MLRIMKQKEEISRPTDTVILLTSGLVHEREINIYCIETPVILVVLILQMNFSLNYTDFAFES